MNLFLPNKKLPASAHLPQLTSSIVDPSFLLVEVKAIEAIPNESIWMTPMTCRQPDLTIISIRSKL